MSHSEIESEQAYLDRAHDRLEAMRAAARSLSAEVVAAGAGGTFANRVERDIRVELSGRRLAQLNIGDASVSFGRLDYLDGLLAYVGRIGVSDENGDQLVVDWRAPVAEPFYRATPAEPLGVGRRRHFLFRGRRITGIDDELLDRAAPEDLVLMGEGALLAGLERARTGRMHDIVSTIQQEQDSVIRSELSGVLVVQGGPGTGKTAVALHRAAYLLFTYRQRLERDGVLLVGPNPVFLRYIEQVLPSLGEHTVTLVTPGQLYAGTATVRANEPAVLSELKGDRRMAQLIAQAVRTRERPLRQALVVRYGRHDLRIPARETRRIVELARQRGGTHNARRSLVERQLARSVIRTWRQAEDAAHRAGRRQEVSKEEAARVAAGMVSELRREPAARAALERMWPILTPEELLHDLLGAAALLRDAGKDLFSDEELDRLARPRSATLVDVPWTEADMALLDEAARLLGPPRAARGRRTRTDPDGDEGESWMLDRVMDEHVPDCPACGAQLTPSGSSWQCEQCGRRFRDEQVLGPGESASLAQLRGHIQAWGVGSGVPMLPKGARLFGHVVVDEAQGLSAMQWRALSRRCPAGSFTIVGDLGQASATLAPESWADALSEVRSRSGIRIEELTVNYRTPSEVMELAASVLAETAPGLVPPSSVRESGHPPVFERIGESGLERSVVGATQAERAAIGDGKIAVICGEGELARIAGVLSAPSAGDESLSTTAAREVLDAPLSVLTLDAARGLEFDSVILVEPADLVAEHGQGLRALYVALTRTTRRLRVLHAKELPRGLRAPTTSA